MRAGGHTKKQFIQKNRVITSHAPRDKGHRAHIQTSEETEAQKARKVQSTSAVLILGDGTMLR